MSRLEDLYNAREILRREKLELSDKQEKQLNELEEEIIKKEILPALSKDIAPRLEPIMSDLVLVVEYHPGKPISVALSRKVKISEIVGTKLMHPDPPAEHREGGEHKKPVEDRAVRTGLRVSFPKGPVIAEPTARKTFVKCIEHIGLQRVRKLGLTLCKVPLVSNTQDKKYNISQIPVEDGLYVMTHSNTKQKAQILEKISNQLHLGLKVEII